MHSTWWQNEGILKQHAFLGLAKPNETEMSPGLLNRVSTTTFRTRDICKKSVACSHEKTLTASCLCLNEEKYATILHVLEIILQKTDSAKVLQSQALQSQRISKHRFCKTHFPLQHCSFSFPTPPAPFPFYVKPAASFSSIILGTAVEVTGAQVFQQQSAFFRQEEDQRGKRCVVLRCRRDCGR